MTHGPERPYQSPTEQQMPDMRALESVILRIYTGEHKSLNMPFDQQLNTYDTGVYRNYVNLNLKPIGGIKKCIPD